MELQIGSFGSSLKAVICPPFLHLALSIINVPSLPVVAEGFSLPVSKVELAVCQRRWLACAWELQMLGVGRVLWREWFGFVDGNSL